LILYALILELTAQQYLWADMGVVLGLVVLVPTMGPKPFLQRGKAGEREEAAAGQERLSVCRAEKETHRALGECSKIVTTPTALRTSSFVLLSE